MDKLVFSDSNKKQDYATHSMFRYFGKLPPTLVSRLLDTYCKKDGTLLELMCGSGTALVEAYLRDMAAAGVDINPLGVLISRVKTTKLPGEPMTALLDTLRDYFRDVPDEAFSYFRPATRNLDNWFTPSAQRKLSAIRYFIEKEEIRSAERDKLPLKNLLYVTYAGIIRRASNASPRTGRIFRCAEDSGVDAFEAMLSKLRNNIALIDSLPEATRDYPVLTADARGTGLPSGSFDFILNHPPYFALYKYSSDVLRFELEWLGLSRREIARNEIEDGFKTTDAQLLDKYIRDMTDVFKEMRRLMRGDAISCVVVSDSKLREEQLPVVDRLIDAAQGSGLALREHLLRPVSYAQASYHRSANPNIRTNEDHVLILEKRDDCSSNERPSSPAD